MNYWLMKSEPDVFSIDDLFSRPKQTEPWNGVRNYQARNYMKQMQIGDLVLFYHSNAEPSGVAGICKVTKLAYPDPTQFDKKSDYYDPKSTPENPRWEMVDVSFVKKFKAIIPLSVLKSYKELEKLPLVQKGSRLSVMPIQKKEFEFISSLDK